MLQVVRVGGGVQAGAGQLVEGRDKQGAEASAGAGVGEMDGVRHQGWRVSIGSPSPAVIGGAFFSCTVLLIVCARVLTRLLATVGRAIACAWQDDSAIFIDQWVHYRTRWKNTWLSSFFRCGGAAW